jgi:hypothetical protein
MVQVRPQIQAIQRHHLITLQTQNKNWDNITQPQHLIQSKGNHYNKNAKQVMLKEPRLNASTNQPLHQRQ